MPRRHVAEWRYNSTIFNVCSRFKWSASRPSLFMLEKNSPNTHYIGWVDPRAGLGAVEKRQLSYTCQKSNPDLSVAQPEDQTL
jgi:hypothetical protein